MNIFKGVPAVLVLLLLFSCSSKATVKPQGEFDPEKSFAVANKQIDAKDYNDARATLLEIRNRDLTKKYAPLAQLRIADSYVKEEEPELAVAEYRKFLELYPDHRHASYAQYQVAMVYFNQIDGPERGYGGAAQALAEFEKLKKDFPRNPYKDLLELRIEKCRNVIADYELLVGEFYMKNNSYAAAIDRFENILKKYPEYKKQDNVLLNLGISYRKTGQKEKSETSLKQLVDRFPGSRLVAAAKKELSTLQTGKK
ncbi:MAG: outer membrane protein assembly factor BamD [Nitrospiraceae bacterium]|nr:outer membrane protein assembly factor BamD [Nitrospiraceae bacterium]